MKIIDAHLHFCDWPGFDELAIAAGHENSEAHMRQAYKELGIACGIVMGNRSLEPTAHVYPEIFRYCIGLDTMSAETADIRQQLRLVEANLQRPECVGIKLYPGYNHFYIYEERMDPFYALAEKYHKPVAVHTGLTATSNALLKYSHPMVLDEAAVRHPQVQFVMCHMGNPWLQDAIAVLEKNKNVAADLSGLLEGKIPDLPAFFHKKRGYIHMLQDWFEYLEAYDRLMFGTDWPLANLGDDIAYTKEIIPAEHWEKVFFANANRIYQLQLQ